jgi:hypothetical protein
MNTLKLRAAVNKAGHDSHFFDRSTMSFFGDTISNYKVYDTNIQVYGDNIINGKYEIIHLPVYELARINPVKHGIKNSAYFNKETFARVFRAPA